MKVHLYTDMSLAVRHRIATFGLVIAWPDNARTVSHHGLMKFHGDSVMAELFAVKHGLEYAIEHGYVSAGDHVTIFSDSTEAVLWLNGERAVRHRASEERRRKGIRTAIFHQTILRVAHEAGIDITAEWVKGHQRERESVHGEHNRTCDILARKLLREAVAGKSVAIAPTNIDIETDLYWAQKEAQRAEANARQKRAYLRKKAAKTLPPGTRFVAFWECPDWSGGDNLRDAGVDPFWMIPTRRHRVHDWNGEPLATSALDEKRS